MMDDLAQIRDGRGVVARMDIVVGKGIVPFLPGTPVKGVTLHIADDILGVVQPVFLDIALGQPRPCPSIDGGLGLIDTTHIGKGGGSIVESTLMEL